MRRHEAVDLAIRLAWQHLGIPYKWGGDDQMAGFDCSGFVVEILKAVGVLPRNADYTAQGLYNLFKHHQEIPYAGRLVFWGSTDEAIHHVEFCISQFHTIGASGGGSSTRTVEDAIRQNAYIRLRPVRTGYVACVMPFGKYPQ